MPLKILYEDNHLIAVFKPAGILTQGDASGAKNLMDEVKNYLKETYKKPGNVFLGLIHRLDRPVSGVILFAKTTKGASRVSAQFRNHEVKKIYQAVVEGIPAEKQATLKHYLLKNENTNTTKVFNEPTADTQEAFLSYKVLESKDNKSLLEVVLGTGRSHQIRAQLSSIGHPIVGDTKYGSKEKTPTGEIMLRAVSLTFKKATEDEEVTVTTEPLEA